MKTIILLGVVALFLLFLNWRREHLTFTDNVSGLWESAFPSSRYESNDSTAPVISSTPPSVSDAMASVVPSGTPLPAVITPGAAPVEPDTPPPVEPATTTSTQPSLVSSEPLLTYTVLKGTNVGKGTGATGVEPICPDVGTGVSDGGPGAHFIGYCPKSFNKAICPSGSGTMKVNGSVTCTSCPAGTTKVSQDGYCIP